jgi:hypothetical protein
MERRRVLMMGAQKSKIPLDGLIFGFQPQEEWNATNPRSIKDVTGEIDIAVNGTFGSTLFVQGNKTVRCLTDTAFSMAMPMTELQDGFTETMWFENNPSLRRSYFTIFRTDQLAWIYGYKTHKLEFYDYIDDARKEMFRVFTATEIVDQNRHFVAISYDAKTGDTLFQIDAAKKTATLIKAVFSLASTPESILGRHSNTTIGQTLFYDRPLSSDEIDIIYKKNGVL